MGLGRRALRPARCSHRWLGGRCEPGDRSPGPSRRTSVLANQPGPPVNRSQTDAFTRPEIGTNTLSGACDIASGWPLPGRGQTKLRFELLCSVAQDDLVFGRLVEAHADAVAITTELGRPLVNPGQRWGVWAAGPADSVRARRRRRNLASGRNESVVFGSHLAQPRPGRRHHCDWSASVRGEPRRSWHRGVRPEVDRARHGESRHALCKVPSGVGPGGRATRPLCDPTRILGRGHRRGGLLARGDHRNSPAAPGPVTSLARTPSAGPPRGRACRPGAKPGHADDRRRPTRRRFLPRSPPAGRIGADHRRAQRREDHGPSGPGSRAWPACARRPATPPWSPT